MSNQRAKGVYGRAYEKYLKDEVKRRAAIRAAYRRERSLRAVAAEFGLTRGRVSQIVNSNG